MTIGSQMPELVWGAFLPPPTPYKIGSQNTPYKLGLKECQSIRHLLRKAFGMISIKEG